MSKTLRIISEELAPSQSLWDRMGLRAIPRMGTRTEMPCLSEYKALIECLALTQRSSCLPEYLSLAECFRSHGVETDDTNN